jgi:hypothetical protein
MYVARLKKNSPDYAFTLDRNNALPMTEAEWRDFAAYMLSCDGVAFCEPV